MTTITPVPDGLLVLPSSDAHWYTKKGEPVFRVPYKDPKRSNETRPTDLRDARVLRLFPGVTGVISKWEKPIVSSWRVDQAIRAALTLPVVEGETADDRARRIVEDAEAYMNQARDAGSVIHEQIARWLTTGVLTGGDVVEAFAEWWTLQGFECKGSEYRVVNREHGYAGTLDVWGWHQAWEIVADLKTQEPPEGASFNYYEPEWPMQLAAYDAALPENPERRLMNIVVHRTVPGRIDAKLWKPRNKTRTFAQDKARWFAAFLAILTAWKLINDYDPCAGE